MIITEKDLLDQRELIQNDLECVLDGFDDDIAARVCQVIVDRFDILLDKLPDSEKPHTANVAQLRAKLLKEIAEKEKVHA